MNLFLYSTVLGERIPSPPLPLAPYLIFTQVLIKLWYPFLYVSKMAKISIMILQLVIFREVFDSEYH